MVLYSFMRQHWPVTIAWIWFNIVCILYCTRQYYIRQYQVLCHFRYHGLPFFLFLYYRDAVSISRIGLGLQWDFRLRIQLLCFLWRKSFIIECMHDAVSNLQFVRKELLLLTCRLASCSITIGFLFRYPGLHHDCNRIVDCTWLIPQVCTNSNTLNQWMYNKRYNYTKNLCDNMALMLPQSFAILAQSVISKVGPYGKRSRRQEKKNNKSITNI